MEPSEAEIINGCLAGNSSSQRMLYKHFAGKMLLVCMRYITNKDEAEDVLQEGFMLVFQKLSQFKAEGSFEGWIRKIMVNKSIEHLRKSSFIHPMVNIEETENDFISADDIISSISSKELLNIIQELPPACRIVFNLYVFEGLKHREIAGQLGISEGTSKSNLSDARAILKKKIRPNIITSQANNA